MRNITISNNKPNAEVVYEIDYEKFTRLLLDTLRD